MDVCQPFIKAVPVWARGRQTEMNLTCRFSAVIRRGGPCMVRMTGSSVYRMMVNGQIAAYGPARGPKAWFRVDEIDLAPFLDREENAVTFEVAGYNINNFYLMDQPSFFCCEILRGDEPLAWTGAGKDGMPCVIVRERVRKVQKYSFQRPFVEAWRLGGVPDEPAELEACGEKQYLPRRVAQPTLAKLPAAVWIGRGSARCMPEPQRTYTSREIDGIDGVTQKGFAREECEVLLSDDACRYVFEPEPMDETAVPEALCLPGNSYATVRFPQNLTGFIGVSITAAEAATVILGFDELYDQGDINFFHATCTNIVRVDVQPGERRFLSMEPYTLQYLKMIAFGGDVTIRDVHLVEYAAPDKGLWDFRTEDPVLRSIWDAAVQTYRQNAVDLFMDCPGRERAGWLCDSFWTARTEYALTGRSVVERNFLENFLLPERFDHIPEGMFPMCYPADHNDGVYIPNWAMWLLMELKEYAQRSGDGQMIGQYREKVYRLFAFLDRYLNEDGLLERLDSWVFVEWSKANSLVKDVNFPTNMLYAACKKAMGELYADPALIAQGDAMQATIRRLSYNGQFFSDRLVRDGEGVLRDPGDVTEVCQYYAFYFGTATPEMYPTLWQTLLRDFGPRRKQTGAYPRVHFANAFIGNYLRLDMMAQQGAMAEVVDNIRDYFHTMARTTGTLWEHDGTSASLDHGFASHVAVWLKQAEGVV